MSSAEQSNFDVDFSIPSIEETPTLEEILTKENDDDDNDCEFLDQLINQDLSDIIEIEDLNSKLSISNNNDKTYDDLQNASSSFNVEELVFIKTQLSLSQQDRIDSGKPTSLTVSKNFISIGTFNGYILIFNFEQEKLSGFCKHEKEFGSITSLSINKDETRIICGGSRGLVSLWNLLNFEIIRQVQDIHAPFSSILNIEYLSNNNFIILNDSSGSVFVLDVRKKNLDSQCVFSGSRGEALMLKPLTWQEIPKNVSIYNGLENLCLLAMATVSKIIVISIRPAVVIHFTFTLKGNLDFLPLICWNLNFDYDMEIIPLLTFARQNQLYIHRMVTDFAEKIDFIPLFQFTTTNYYLQQCYWLDNDKLFLMDTNENGHLIDVPAQEEMERIDLSNMELIYESANYKSLAMGGYVSRAMAQAGQHACNNSMFNWKSSLSTSSSDDNDKDKKNQLYALGLRSVFKITLRNWSEKVSYYLDYEKNYLKALKLLYENFLSIQERHSNSMDKDLEKILLKIDQALTKLNNEQIFNCKNEDNLREIISNYLKYSCCLSNKHQKIMDLYENTTAEQNHLIKYCLIECLERFIFDDEFPNLNPIIVQEIIEYYIKKEWFNTLDSLITHLNIASLDIDYIIKIYQQYHLYDSFIYLNNFAFEDFLTPLDSLLNLLKKSILIKKEEFKQNCQLETILIFSKEDIIIGNKLLVYLNCLLTCVYYPNKGSLPDDKQVEHLNQCYKRLTNNQNRNDVDRFDIFNILFQYDCIEFLNIILIAFDFLDRNHQQLFHWKQILIDELIEFYNENNNNSDNQKQFEDEQRNSFFIFLGRCFTDFDSIKINNNHFQMMIDSLFEQNFKRLEERQQILIQLFKSELLKSRIDQELFLKKAEQNQMYKLCELIYQQKKDWIRLFSVYMNDPSKHDKIFNYIDFIVSEKISNENHTDDTELNDFLENVFENFHFLIQLNCQKSVKLFELFLKQCDNLYQLVIDKLQYDQHQLFKFLNEIIWKNRLEFEQNSSSPTYNNSSNLKLKEICFDPKNQEYFIELTCQIEPDNLVDVLDSLKEYDPIRVLDLCRQFRNPDGEAFLLEKMKQYDKSFQVLFDTFQQSINYLLKNLSNKASKSKNDMELKLNFQSICNKYFKLLNFCNRCTKTDQQKFWLEILEYLIKIKTNVKNINHTEETEEEDKEKFQNYLIELNKCLRKFFENLINDMLTNLNFITFLEIIMNKILKQADSIYDFREMLLCILENYMYEKTLLELTTNILSMEHHKLINDFLSLKTKSKRFRQLPQCQLCSTTNFVKFKSQEKFIQLSCNHLFHFHCLEQIKKTMKEDKQENHCPVCHQPVQELIQNSILDDNDDLKKTNKINQNSSRMIFNETQLRILNDLHQGRLRRLAKKSIY